MSNEKLRGDEKFSKRTGISATEQGIVITKLESERRKQILRKNEILNLHLCVMPYAMMPSFKNKKEIKQSIMPVDRIMQTRGIYKSRKRPLSFKFPLNSFKQTILS